MKKGQWFYTSQRLLKNWMNQKGFNGDCAKQTITPQSLEEEWSFYPKEGGMPEAYTFYAYKNTGEVYLLPKYGKPIRVYLQRCFQPFAK